MVSETTMSAEVIIKMVSSKELTERQKLIVALELEQTINCGEELPKSILVEDNVHVKPLLRLHLKP